MSYYIKSIKNSINIPHTFRLNSVFTTDTFFGEILPLMFFIFDMQENEEEVGEEVEVERKLAL